MSDLRRLAEPIRSKYVHQLPGRGNADFVKHSVITQLLLLIVGPFDYEIVREIYGGEKLEGCVARLTVDVDGRRTSIVEAGDITGQESNNGERLKNASSDAFKRCAMRLGLGTHLWAGEDDYFLSVALTKAEGGGASSDAPVSAGTDHSPEIETGVCPECGRDQLPLAERGGHSPRCSRRPM